MRKILNCILALSIIIPIYWSCSKTKKDPSLSELSEKKVDNSMRVLFENKNLAYLDQKQFSILDDRTTRVERIGYDNETLSSLRENLEWQNLLNTYKLDLGDIQRRTLYDREIQIISVPISVATGRQWLIGYVFHNKYVFAIAKEERMENDNLYCAITETTGKIHYDFQVSPENKLGKVRVLSSLKLRETFYGPEKNLNNWVNPPNELNVADDGHVPCCKRAFNDCMNCYLQSCAGDWQCWLLCGFGPGPGICAATWALSCATGSGCGAS